MAFAYKDLRDVSQKLSWGEIGAAYLQVYFDLSQLYFSQFAISDHCFIPVFKVIDISLWKVPFCTVHLPSCVQCLWKSVHCIHSLVIDYFFQDQYSVFGFLVPVVQKINSAIHWRNLCQVDSTIKLLNYVGLAPVVQKLDSAIHWINHYPADKYLENQLRYPMDSGLCDGQRYPPSEQLGPGYRQYCRHLIVTACLGWKALWHI